MILVDTSVWIDYFRGVDSPEAQRLSSDIAGDENLCICGIILTEILQGIKSETRYKAVKRLLKALIYLPIPREAYYLAADIYRAAQKRGHTIRNTVDCIIAASAISNKVQLFQKDRDFLTIASVSKLALVSV